MTDGRGAGRVLVTGATGFVGGALVGRLLASGAQVRVLVRDPGRLTAPWQADVEVVVGDAARAQDVLRAADGVALGYVLVHGMDRTVRDLVERERTMAAALREGAELAGVRRLVYLGGLVDEAALASVSTHLYARYEAGQELRRGDVAVTELRAGIVLGAGSASAQLVLAAARAPVVLAAPWTRSRTQPIALDDLTELLLAVADDRGAAGLTMDVGGPEVLSYGELVGRARQLLGRPDGPRLALPYLPPELIASAAARRARIPATLALGLLPSARHDAVVRDGVQAARYPWSGQTPIDEALAAVITRELPPTGPTPRSGGSGRPRRARGPSRR